MTFTHALSTNNYGPAKFIVATSSANGTHTTLASAMAAASSGDTIFLRDSVTENVTLTPGVNIVSYTGAEFTPTVSITGKLTMTGAGTCTVSGIRLTTNSDFILAVTGSAASIVNLVDCYLNISNNTAISHTSSDGGSQINLYRCDGNIGTTGITVFVSTSAGSMTHAFTRIINNGASTTASTISTSIFFQRYSTIAVPVTTSSVGSLDWDHSKLSATNATGITLAGSGTSSLHLCYLTTGSGSCVSIGTGCTLAIDSSDLNSSNANVLTGAGTLVYSELSYSGTSSGINTTTQTIRPGSSFQKIVVQTFTGSGTYTPTAGMKYCIAEVVGGGGGGAGIPLTGATAVAAGGGGGGAGYARKTFTATTIGTSQTVTIGTGGAGGTGNAAGSTGVATTLGALLTGNGGNGGGNAGAAGVTTVGGGAGGSGSSGDVNITGQGGLSSFGVYSAAGSAVHSGAGGNSILGGGAQAVAGTTATSNNGSTGGTYGGGGSGAASTESQTAKNGGTGGAGICIVTEYI